MNTAQTSKPANKNLVNAKPKSLSKANEITEQQQATLTEIQNHIDEFGFPPTVDELASKMQITKATVHGMLNRLIKKGHLRRTHGKARGIEIVNSGVMGLIALVPVPLLGDVPAGAPFLPHENNRGQVLVQASLVKDSNCFALQVVGESMKDVGIQNGDTVIVRQQQVAESGEIIVASLDGEVTVKRLSIDKGRIELRPANKTFKPISIRPEQDLRILGRVLAVSRPLKG